MSWAGRIAGGALGATVLGFAAHLSAPGLRTASASIDSDQPPEAISSQPEPPAIAVATPSNATPSQLPSMQTGGQAPGDAVLVNFAKGFRWENQRVSDFDVDNDWGLMTFRDRNVRYNADGVQLFVERDRDDDVMPYTMAEVRIPGFYGYGRYEVVMRTSGEPGIVSSFFTHTGAYFGDPHTEIDFEFLGRESGKVRINYHSDGGDSPASIDLGFDPSEAEHLYAFEWMPGFIRWYADGVIVREVRADAGGPPIPATSSRILVNVWAGNGEVESWVGKPSVDSTSAFYRCLSHVPAGKTARQCSDTFKAPPKPSASDQLAP